MSSVLRTISIDPRPDLYRSFFDGSWADRLLRAVEPTKLHDPAVDLIRNWKATSNARSIPWLMVECLKVSQEAAFEEYEPYDRRKLRILTDKLVGHLESKGERIRLMMRRKLQESISEIDAQAEDIIGQARAEVLRGLPDLWETLLQEIDFTTSLWGLERICYSALYYNYEWFLTECIRIKRNNPDYRMLRHDDFNRDLRDDFGPTIQCECWSNQQIVIARYARHALLHNGGRMTKDLEKQPHTFAIHVDEIQVGPSHTRDLYDLLKNKVLEIALVAASMPEFK